LFFFLFVSMLGFIPMVGMGGLVVGVWVGGGWNWEGRRWFLCSVMVKKALDHNAVVKLGARAL